MNKQRAGPETLRLIDALRNLQRRTFDELRRIRRSAIPERTKRTRLQALGRKYQASQRHYFRQLGWNDASEQEKKT